MSRARPPEAALELAERLADLASQRDRLENEILGQVQDVIRAGGSWTTVSDALGVSKQAAWERYKIVPPKYAHPLDVKPS